MNRTSFKAVSVLLFVFFGLLAAAPSQAAVTSVTLSNTSIPFETIGTSGTTISFTIDAGGAVEIDIHKLVSNEPPSADNQIAGISQAGLAPGTYAYFWSALWLLGGDLGRQAGNYRVIVTQGISSYVYPTLANITSVDIHNVSVAPSFDSNNEAAFPFFIHYSLAKASLVTVRISDSLGNVVRTLAANVPQLDESLANITLSWDGLDDNSRPVALGVYTISIDARDSSNGDLAITRTRTIAVQSLANLNSNLQKLFDSNAFVYPNPVRDGTATFQALAVRNNANITVKIYTLAGDLVRKESFNGLTTAQVVSFPWNAENQAGKKLGRGLYYVVVREDDPQGSIQTTKKVAVIP